MQTNTCFTPQAECFALQCGSVLQNTPRQASGADSAVSPTQCPAVGKRSCDARINENVGVELGNPTSAHDTVSTVSESESAPSTPKVRPSRDVVAVQHLELDGMTGLLTHLTGEPRHVTGLGPMDVVGEVGRQHLDDPRGHSEFDRPGQTEAFVG